MTYSFVSTSSQVLKECLLLHRILVYYSKYYNITSTCTTSSLVLNLIPDKYFVELDFKLIARKP